MSKRLVDTDDDALLAAQSELGTKTIRDTINESLRRVTNGRQERVSAALDHLGAAELDDRSDAWR
jgi:Arc/MetJ family transcription regulator